MFVAKAYMASEFNLTPSPTHTQNFLSPTNKVTNMLQSKPISPLHDLVE